MAKRKVKRKSPAKRKGGVANFGGKKAKPFGRRAY